VMAFLLVMTFLLGMAFLLGMTFLLGMAFLLGLIVRSVDAPDDQFPKHRVGVLPRFRPLRAFAIARFPHAGPAVGTWAEARA